LIFSGYIFSPVSRVVFWVFVGSFFLLTWLGMCPAEEPYVGVALFMTIVYFFVVLILIVIPRLVSFFYVRGN
jgi:quinol-cytochrome oxidoreductase complex cytochrome b subunit